MLRKVLSILIISSISFGVIGCNKTDSSKEQANNNSKPKIIQTSEKKVISKSNFKDLKATMNIDTTNLLQDNFHSNKNIKNVIVAQKSKSEDANQKDMFIFFNIEKDKINNINSEEISNKAIQIITKNKGDNFWKEHNATIFFQPPGNDDLKPYTVFMTKQGSNKLMEVNFKND